jgi:general secretion pathway protein A
MYNEYFGLKEAPFSIAPDPRYLYMSEQHREALAHLVYGFNGNGGFVLLTGEVGTGKTTVCRCLLEQIPDNTAIAFILNPKLTVQELLATICDEFGIAYPEDNDSVKVFVDLINAYLLDAHSKGRKAVLLIDEAQNLDADVLEQLRLLTNLETNQKKLLQIMLIGQPELRDKLSKPELRQLSQRIIARYHLGSISKREIGNYVSHRLSVAGRHNNMFSDSTMKTIYGLSGGVPRLINVLCDRALLGTYTLHKSHVSSSTLKKAAHEVLGESKSQSPGHIRKASAWIFPVFFLIVVGVVLAASYYKEDLKQVPVLETPEQLTADAIPLTIEEAPLKDLDWPDHQPRNKSNDLAFQELFNLWGVSFQQNIDVPACDQAVSRGLKCYESLGSIDILRNLNRPAVLKLSDDSEMVYYVTLTAVKNESALVIIGEELREVSLDNIKTSWLGEYTLLWRPPPDYSGVISPGANDPVVRWIDKQLLLDEGRSIEHRESTEYDSDLVTQVKKYQLAAGLIPDGIVGTQTLIHLSAVGDDVPLLNNTQEDN